MLFVPLTLFATLLLGLAFVRFCLTRDMRLRAHQLFALLVALYAAQSLWSSLRWGYGIEWAATALVLMAPLLPVVAYLAYISLSGTQKRRQLWPPAVIVLNWLVFAFAPDLSDPLILMTYIGFGTLLVQFGLKGTDDIALSPISEARDIRFAILLTGVALIASGVTDIYIIYDFVRNDGRNTGLVLTFVQTAFVLIIGGAGLLGRSSEHQTREAAAPAYAPERDQADGEVLARLEHLFETEEIYRDEDLSLRRLARKVGVPDRQLSVAINRLRSVSVSQFVNQYRIQDACALLQNTERSVLDISLASGFATKSNFNREFLRVTGQSPTEWRRRVRRSGTSYN